MDARVLLVEDDSELLEFIRVLLDREGYQVITAMDGMEALEKARAEHPDLILLDVLLPKLHGYEVCDQLRQNPLTCLIPVIMVTSLTNLKDRITGIKLGADEFISKPFEPMELLARAERLIQRTRQNIVANPLTGLAGAGALEQEIRRRLSEGAGFSVGLCDLEHFNRFNDKNGFEKGDGVLRLLGTILRSAIAELGNPDDIAAHLGGDDFAFISTPSRSEVIGARILENMESLIPMQYEEQERESLLISREEGKGNPFLPLRIGIVDVLPGLYQHHAQVLDRAKAALSEARNQGGNFLAKLS
jgi:diguanylate cyclase (GGDEF)-like protein